MTNPSSSVNHHETPPILFLVFRRPALTARVFAAIRLARPSHLFVAADGPRPDHPGEAARCEETRKLATMVDWPCEVQTLFRDQNLGCGPAISGAIHWFFEHVEEGIILEDDCLPDPSFFPYCAELLAHYRHDTRVMHIAGYNPLDHGFGDGSYYFSPIMHCWGWATWKRVADQYDYRIKNFSQFEQDGLIRGIFRRRLQQRYWLRALRRYYRGLSSNWDHQWAYLVFSQHGLCVNPCINLVQNLGFGADSTFAANPWSYHGRRHVGQIAAIRHPSFLLPYPDAADQILRKANGVWLPRMIAVWWALLLIRPLNVCLRPFGRKIL